MAVTADFGVCPVDKGIRRVFKERVKTFGRAFGLVEDASPDFTDLHDVFEVHRGLSFVASHQERLAKHRDLLDANVIDNTERGLKLTAAEIGRGFVAQHAMMKRVNDFFDDYDIVIAPAAAVSPFPHEQLFVEAINGKAMPTYTRWLSIAYAPTTALCCALALPCGVDDNGLPFGIQVVGRRGSDLAVLEIGLALEAALAGDDATRRPIPPILRS